MVILGVVPSSLDILNKLLMKGSFGSVFSLGLVIIFFTELDDEIQCSLINLPIKLEGRTTIQNYLDVSEKWSKINRIKLNKTQM